MDSKPAKSTKAENKRHATSIYHAVQGKKPTKPEPTKSLDSAVNDIYLQAHNHRNKLVTFYIVYTVAFSIFVALLITYQAMVRSIPGKETIEVIPEWALSLLVAGMFGQFISLLTIVTTKVWTFEPFLNHAKRDPKSPSNT